MQWLFVLLCLIPFLGNCARTDLERSAINRDTSAKEDQTQAGDKKVEPVVSEKDLDTEKQGPDANTLDSGTYDNPDANLVAGDADVEGGSCAPSDMPICGDGKIQNPEQCDDGANEDPYDGCNYRCRFTCNDPDNDCAEDVAGDCQKSICNSNDTGRICQLTVDMYDLPDDSNPCTKDLCSPEPSHPYEYDGIGCDNDAGVDGDYCSQGECIEPFCGDNITGPLEQCDDGNDISNDGCSALCVLESCGDKKIDSNEQCDDGRDGDPNDGCTDMCRFTCNDPEDDCIGDTAGDCQQSVCAENDAGRICESASDTDDAQNDNNPCTIDLCNPWPDNPAVNDGTACDNSTGFAGDYCVQGDCIESVCGDEITGPLEQCDDGNRYPCDNCLPNCTIFSEQCGNGFVCPPEQCDDGNRTTGDGCSSECESEFTECPADMVLVAENPDLGVTDAFCMDRYEASRLDATFTSMGANILKAVSQPNVIPWHYNPMNKTHMQEFMNACENADKHLCAKNEWYAACTGPTTNTYAFGNIFNRETCNCVDTFCDDYCAENNMSSCNTSKNCGYDYYCFQVEPTGQFPNCVNQMGAYDINGNVWEVVPSTTDAREYEVRGGAFNCGNPGERLKCNYNAGWTSLYAGFRCCSAVISG